MRRLRAQRVRVCACSAITGGACCPSVRGNRSQYFPSITLFTVASKELFNPPGQRKCCSQCGVYTIYVYTHIPDVDGHIRRLRQQNVSLCACVTMNVLFYGCGAWHRKVGHLTTMIPVGVIFITFKRPQRAFLSTIFSCKLTAALPLCTVVSFASESLPLNCKPTKTS